MSNLASNMPTSHMIERTPALGLIAHQQPLSGRVSLQALPEGLVAHVLGFETTAAALKQLQQRAEERELFLRETSLDQWFLVGDNPYNANDWSNLVHDLQPDFMLSDQSAGRVRLRLEAQEATHILNKGIALDLSLTSFPIEKSTPCLCGHIGVHLTRLGEHVFELMVLRSFGTDLWQQLVEMAQEYQ